jgi:hypothetical protein
MRVKRQTIPWSTPAKFQPIIHQALRHLVFCTKQTQQKFSYEDLYEQGLERRSLNSMSMLAEIYQNKPLSTTFKSFDHGLHIMMKRAFSLDGNLLVNYCKTMPLEEPVNQKIRGLDESLAQWIHRLTVLHEHLMPLSKIIFDFEKNLKAPLTLAQTLVLIKDQIQVAHTSSSDLSLESLGDFRKEISFLEWLSGKVVYT